MMKLTPAHLAGLTLALAACTAIPTPATQAPPPTQAPAATTLPPTAAPDTAVPPTGVPATAIPPTEPPPTAIPPTAAPATSAATAAPTAAPADQVTRISFAAGATHAGAQGQLQANEIRTFVVNAAKDQPMIVLLDSPNQNVRLTIYGQTDGQPLVRAASDATSWQGLLPATQDYVIKAVGPAAATNFSLYLEIPHRLTFAPGATAVEYDGQLQGSDNQAFVLAAGKGQPMLVNLDSPNQDVRLTVYGFEDGQPLVRDVSGATSWQGLLPADQNYIVKAVGPAGPEHYHLSIEIAHRIVFDKGAVTASVSGKGSAGPVVTYVLRAQAGQTLTAALTSAGNSVLLTVYGFSDGQPLVRAASGATSFTTKLPATQDYIIKAVQSGTPADFTLNVTVK